MPDYDHWFRETEKGKKPEPDSPAHKEKKDDAFLAKNIDSYAEFLEERKHPKGTKPTIKDPIMRAILDFDGEEKK